MIQSQPSSDARESFRLVLVASAVTLALWFIPYAELAVYPIRLFVTYVHEICHAAASIVTLGWPSEIEIYWDGSGATRTNNMNLLVASAGYVGTVAIGAALLLVGARRRFVRPALVTSGVAMALAAAWLGGNLLAWVGGLGIAVALLVIGSKASFGVARFTLTFLAIQCMLNALSDLRWLFWLSVSGSEQTDAQNMAAATYGLVPAVVWSVIWAAIALAVLVGAVRLYYVTTVRHSFGPGQPF
jgi:hypothetical protein